MVDSNLPQTVTYSAEQIELIKKTIAKGASNDELKLFMMNCKRLQLDPFAKQIYFVKYGSSPGTIIVGLDGFRAAAHRTGQLSGIERGANLDSNGKVLSGWAKVYRKDWDHPAYEEVPFSEYNTGKGNWVKMPQTMIKKVAEVAALRMAFPSDLSGVYAQEEMDQAQSGTRQHTIVKSQEVRPTPDHSVTSKAVPTTLLNEQVMSGAITKTQHQNALRLCEEFSVNQTQLKDFLQSRYGVMRFSRLTRDEYNELCLGIEGKGKKTIHDFIGKDNFDDAPPIQDEPAGLGGVLA